MANSHKRKRLRDAYCFDGFRPLEEVRGIFGDPVARVVTLVRRSKKQSARSAASHTSAGTIEQLAEFAIFPAATHGSIWRSRYAGFDVDAMAR